jgi:DNA-binding transcriptional MerR regulator
MSSDDFHFEPPDRRQSWRNLSLTMSQAAALTGVSERQIQHWMDKGYVEPALHGARKIGGAGLDAIMLIKQARAAGIPLRQAVPMAHDYLSREASNALDSDLARWAARDLRERLAAAHEGIEAVQRVLDSVDSPDGKEARQRLPALARNRV